MTEVSRVAAPRGLELRRLLLESKLAIPSPRSEFVSHAALIRRARAADRRIVAVTAPSGYGKSSFMSQWAASESRAVAWVSLDRFDDEPGTLLTLLASAFVRAVGADPALIAEMHGHGPSTLGRAAPRLAMALRTSESPFVLMLDDLHELNSPACHDLLNIVIGGIVSGSQLVTSSRSEQPHVPRLRAAGETLEIQADSLALDAAGVKQIFATEQVSLDLELADTIADRTEGWPVGIYLAAVIAHHADGAAEPLTGDDPYVADYLYRESMGSLSDESRHFLRCTAILDQFSADLCDALLEQIGSQSILRELEASNVFIIPLDRHREWFRYHQLFREFLLGELRRVAPELIPELHMRAADWYEMNGSPAMAIEHLLETPERERCIKLVAEVALPTYQNGRIDTVDRWLTTLGSSAVEIHPPLGVLAAWIAVVAGHPREADRWAAKLARMSFDFEPLDGSASFNSSRAMLRSIMFAAGPEEALADARSSLAEEPAWSPWRDQALCLSGEAHLALGDAVEADKCFAEASELATTAGNHDVQVLCDSERAMIAMDHGRWVEGAEYVDSALATIEEHRIQDYLTSVLAIAGAARLALHRGDQKDAIRQLTKAMRARPVCTYAAPALSARIRLYLAKTHWAVGDRATAMHLLHEIDDLLTHRPALGAIAHDINGLREIVSASTRVTDGHSPLTPAELRLLPYLQTHLSFPDIGARLFVSRNTVSTEVGSIYRKLGVSSRSEAVDRATAIGLLGA